MENEETRIPENATSGNQISEGTIPDYQASGNAHSGSKYPASAPLGTSGMAVAALVLGIVGVLTSYIPIANNGSFVMGILGVIFAIIGIVGINKGKKKGRGLAIAGLVLSIVTLVVVLITQSFYGAVLDSAQESMQNASRTSTQYSSPSSADSAVASSATAAAESSDAAVAADGSDAEYKVSIDGAEKTTDYKGQSAILVTYTWTNNSGSDQIFSVALNAQCFQNGVQLDSAVVSGQGSDSMKDIKPGATQTVQKAYELADSSPVTVEVSEMFSWNDEILAEATFEVQ